MSIVAFPLQLFWAGIISMKQGMLQDLANKKLDDWMVRQVVEVYGTDSDGRYSKSIAWFSDFDLAEAFKDQQPDQGFCGIAIRWALLNDEMKKGVVFTSGGEDITLMDEAEVRKGVRATALNKLTPAERKALADSE